jgi:hypothetical protein
MSHYDDTERENWHESLRYDTHGFWFAHVGTTYIQIPGVIYERLLTAYLQSHGLTRKTYIQIFGEAESIWLKQVSLEMEFRRDWQMWLFSDVPGIYIRVGE